MQSLGSYSRQISEHIASMATEKQATATKRYFPEGERFIGVKAADITLIIKRFHYGNQTLSAAQPLKIVEHLLINAKYSEEILIAFGLLNGSIKKNFDTKLLVRFKYWLENYATNWPHVDDLRIKPSIVFYWQGLN